MSGIGGSDARLRRAFSVVSDGHVPLSDMFSQELSQSRRLRVWTPARLAALTDLGDGSADDVLGKESATKALLAADVDTLLAGRFYRDAGDLIISAELRDVASGRALRSETVRVGSELDELFLHVSSLTSSLREKLSGDRPELLL